jgi:hypothetical protein
MDQTSAIGRAVMGFIAGALSVVTVMSAAWWLTQAAGYIPANANPLWTMEPRVPVWIARSIAGMNWDIPRVANLAFWGGVWGLALSLLFAGLRGAAWWLAWILAGAIVVAAMAIWGVPAIKGQPLAAPSAQRLLISGFLNGMWGLGAAIWLMLLGRGRA